MGVKLFTPLQSVCGSSSTRALKSVSRKSVVQSKLAVQPTEMWHKFWTIWFIVLISSQCSADSRCSPQHGFVSVTLQEVSAQQLPDPYSCTMQPHSDKEEHILTEMLGLLQKTLRREKKSLSHCVTSLPRQIRVQLSSNLPTRPNKRRSIHINDEQCALK